MPIIIDKIVNDIRDRYNTAVTTINREIVFSYTALFCIFIVAYMFRILGIFRYEIILGANDPYSQYRAAAYIEENGLAAFLSWVDTQTWYPEGRFWGKSQFIGTPLSAVLIYQFTSLIGLDIPLNVICFYQPALFGAISCIAIYFLGKEVANKKVGLISAFFLAISAGHLQRTVVGFFDNEALGIFLLILILYFYARSLRTGSEISAILSGICLGILSGSWGASTYVFNLLALHAFILLLVKKHSDRLLLSYGGTILVSLFISVLIPRNGPTALLTTNTIIPIGILGLLLMADLYRYLNSIYDLDQFRIRIKQLYPVIVILFILGIGSTLLLFPDIFTRFSSKFLTVLLPIFRDSNPILKSVSEHQIVVWSTFYRNIGLLIFFVPLSIYYLYEKPTERNILVLLFGITSIYFAGSMVRLALILAPAVSILAAKAIDQTLLPFVLTFQERFTLSRRKTRFTQPLTNEHTAIAFVFIGLFLLASVLNSTDAAVKSTHAPSILTVVPSGGGSYAIGNDWQEAISWLDYNTGPTDVVASWWDYGYWISGNSDVTILVDNATINKTKIANVGCMLVLNPWESLKIAKIYDVAYIVLLVSDGYGTYGFDSDLGKVPWFIRIGEDAGNIVQIDQDDYLEYDSRGQYITGYIDEFYNSVFWALYTNPITNNPTYPVGVSDEAFSRIASEEVGYGPIQGNAPATGGFLDEYAEYSEYYELAYKSKHNWVYVWKIRWDLIPPGAIAP
ncbi:MAG: STT3 domain-containing protein [Candidatus Hodarchaeota archaeon]